MFLNGDRVPWHDGDVDVCAALWLPSEIRGAAPLPAVGTLWRNSTKNGRGIANASFDAEGGIRVAFLHGGRKPQGAAHGWQIAARDDIHRTANGRGGYRLDLPDPTRGTGPSNNEGGTGRIRKSRRRGAAGAAGAASSQEDARERRRRAFRHVWGRFPTDSELHLLLAQDANSEGQAAAAAVGEEVAGATDGGGSVGERERRARAFEQVWWRRPTEAELDAAAGAAAPATASSATTAAPPPQRPAPEVADVVDGIIDAVAAVNPEAAAVAADAGAVASGPELAAQIDALRAGLEVMDEDALA